MDKPKPNKLAQFYSGQIQPKGALSLRRSVQFWSGVDNATRSGLTVEEFDYCAVLGILDTSTNGLRDLVCDRREIFTFDGIEYLPIKMPEKKNGKKN